MKTKKLNLKRETVRRLSATELARIDGGGVMPTRHPVLSLDLCTTGLIDDTVAHLPAP